MIEFTYAYSHEHAMMVVFMHASITFIAMPHSNPLIESTDLAYSFFVEHSIDFDVAMLLITEGVMFYD